MASCIGSGEDSVAEERGVMSAYDAAAPTFERHRALPDGVPRAIRAAVLAAITVPSPRLLDLGAGTGRFGRPFVSAGDDYVGIDLSFGMLREFAAMSEPGRVAPRLAQADGERLPFADKTFDAVLMVQVFGGMRGWRRVLAETRRVLRPPGALVLGRTITPSDGLDARMKERLAQILVDLGAEAQTHNAREDAQSWLGRAARRGSRAIAATWEAPRTARSFLDRHRDGARFLALPKPLKGQSLRRLADWAASTFGSLDAAVREQYAFELQFYEFPPGDAHA
jgi:ubiquinone/menaquinone biosynthesis C-methylase UbiE